MTIETPPHAQGLALSELFHGGDVTVASGAVDGGADVDRMVEERVVRKTVHPDPSNGLARLGADAKGLERLTIARYQGVAVHARLSGRKRRDGRNLDAGMTVAAVDLELARVQSMAERNRLMRHVADVRVCRGERIPHEGGQADRTGRSRK